MPTKLTGIVYYIDVPSECIPSRVLFTGYYFLSHGRWEGGKKRIIVKKVKKTHKYTTNKHPVYTIITYNIIIIVRRVFIFGIYIYYYYYLVFFPPSLLLNKHSLSHQFITATKRTRRGGHII